MTLTPLKPTLKGLTLAFCSLLLFNSPMFSQTNSGKQSTPVKNCLSISDNDRDNDRVNWDCRVGRTSAVIFECSPDTNENGVETLSVVTKAPNAPHRYRIPVVRFTSNYFSQSSYTPRKRCEKIATRFQHFHNCGILDNLSRSNAVDARTGKTYPAIFAEVKPALGEQLATQDLCPALKATNGKLLLLMFDPGIEANQIEEKLNDLRLGNFPEPLSDHP